MLNLLDSLLNQINLRSYPYGCDVVLIDISPLQVEPLIQLFNSGSAGYIDYLAQDGERCVYFSWAPTKDLWESRELER